MASGKAMNEIVDVEERVITKNGKFWLADDAGRGHWLFSEEIDVAGVDEEDTSSRSFSEPWVEDMVSVRSKVVRPDMRFEMFADPDDSEPEVDVFFRMLGGADSSCEGVEARGERGDVGMYELTSDLWLLCPCEWPTWGKWIGILSKVVVRPTNQGWNVMSRNETIEITRILER